ncbi:MAG: DoxX family membrane protein [Spirochaetes bacterium]|nr:DoxX family membrane protein [Spirochaetota bacterium]
MGGESGIRRGIGGILYGNMATASVRLVLGALLLFAGSLKIGDPEQFALVIARYGVLPDFLLPYGAVMVPVLEALTGILLIIGYRVRAASLVGAVMMALFSLFIAVAMAGGERFDCGCFYFGRLGLGISETVGPWVLARDLVFLAGFLLLLRAHRHLFSLENFIEKIRLRNLEKTRYE